MKKLLILSIFLFSQLLYSQNDEVIILEEVIINNSFNENNYSSRKIKNKEKSKELFSISNDYAFITKVIDPNIIGDLKTVEFFFDKIKEENDKDVFFELVLLTENNDLEPGESLTNKPFLFKINNKKKNSIKLDLHKYKVFIDKPFFIGLRKIKDSDKYDFKIFLVESNKFSSGIYINIKNEKWLKPPNFKNNTIKINIEINKPEN